MHHPKLKYNQQKWIWIIVHETCMFISISCLQLSHFAEISVACTFPCTTEWENHQGCIAVIKVVLITTHVHHLGSCTGEHRIWMPSSPPLPQHLRCLHTLSVYNKILSGLGEFTQVTIVMKERSGSLCVMLDEWMLDPTALTSPSLPPKKKLSCWKADPPRSLPFIFSEDILF